MAELMGVTPPEELPDAWSEELQDASDREAPRMLTTDDVHETRWIDERALLDGVEHAIDELAGHTPLLEG